MKLNRQNLTYNVHPIAWQCAFRCFVTFLLWPPVTLQGFALFTVISQINAASRINAGLASYLKPKSRLFPLMKGCTEKKLFPFAIATFVTDHTEYSSRNRNSNRGQQRHTHFALFDWLWWARDNREITWIEARRNVHYVSKTKCWLLFSPLFLILLSWQSFKRKCSD